MYKVCLSALSKKRGAKTEITKFDSKSFYEIRDFVLNTTGHIIPPELYQRLEILMDLPSKVFTLTIIHVDDIDYSHEKKIF